MTPDITRHSVGQPLAGRGTVVVLTGPSSAGKTSIAECLRRITPRPAIFLSGDDLDLPPESEAVSRLRLLPREASRLDRPAGIAELTTHQEWAPPDAGLVVDTAEVDSATAAHLIASRLT